MRDRILLWIAEIAWRRPLAIVAVAAGAAVFASLYAANSLVLNANTDDLVAPDRPFMVEYRRLLEEFGDLEHIYVVIENRGDVQRTRAAVDVLTAKLRAIVDLPAVHSGIESHEQLRLTTRAIDERELEELALASGAFSALASGSTATVIAAANELLTKLIQSGVRMDVQEQRRTGAAAVFLLRSIAAANENSSSRNELNFLVEPPPREYFKSDTGRYYFIDIAPSKDYGTLSVVEEPLRKIRAAIAEARRDFPDITFGLTGKPVLQADEMATSNADMTKASVLAIVLVAALFMFSFGGFWKPLLAVIAFAFAGAWTYGFAALAVGQLNLLSIVFMLVLIGVGLDYGIHVLTRYREFRATSGVEASISQAIVSAGRGNITGAATSAAVFFMALATNFQGLRELGLIAGAGLLLCVIAMTVVLPALLAMMERRRGNLQITLRTNASPPGSGPVAGMFSALGDYPVPVLAFAGVLSLGLVLAPGIWRFEYNLLQLQARNLESVEWERRILSDSASASWFGAVIADSQDEAREIIDRARQYTTIGSIRSLFDVVPPSSSRREELRSQLPPPPELPAPEAVNVTWSAGELQQAASALAMIALGAARQAPEEAATLNQISNELRNLIEELNDPRSSEAAKARVDQIVAAVGESIRIILRGNQLDLRGALPDSLRDQYISPANRHLVMLHPRNDVWDYEPMRQFVADLRAVDPNATGAPISHFESLGDMQQAFLTMAMFSVLVIAGVLWLDFGSIARAGLALVPTILGLIWLFEIMALFGISFNLANFFSVPMLIGLSVDGSIHVMHRHMERRGQKLDLGATRKAVIVTALTTTIGFGCMIIAQHRGLRSLGMVMAIGSVSCLVASIVVLPAILELQRRLSRHADDSAQKG